MYNAVLGSAQSQELNSLVSDGVFDERSAWKWGVRGRACSFSSTKIRDCVRRSYLIAPNPTKSQHVAEWRWTPWS